MLIKAVVLFLAVLVVGVSFIGYTPLPPGVHDPYRTQLFMGMYKLLGFVMKVKEFLGFGDFYSQLQNLQRQIVVEGDPPPSSKYGDVKVTRGKLASVPVIFYRPVGAADVSPAFIYLHGGGWVMGTADESDATAYAYAKATNILVINVDYRRAPQFPFPTPVQDCLEVTKYILKHGDKYGINVNKVGIGGDSAGANLAAAVALTISKAKTKLPALKFQVLSFPSLQVFDLRLPSYLDNNDTLPILTSKDVAAFYSLYLGLDNNKTDYYARVISENRHVSPQLRESKYSDYVSVKLLPQKFRTPSKNVSTSSPASYDTNVFAKIKHIITNPMLSPLMSADLTGLPPAYLHACEFDVVRDDALLYARRLQDAGVRVKVHYGHGGFHSDTSKFLPEFLQPRSGKAAFKSACDFIQTILKN